ncbi:MAG TPA: hypothetical protein VF278_07620 [Pirellulales bacterium]
MDDVHNAIPPSAAHHTRRWCEAAVIAAAAMIAIVSARDYAGGWNDGSRLATVEALVDHRTLAIDQSIFVRSPAHADAPNPYTPGDESLRLQGTQDKLLIDGHYYSDKSPLPAFWLAACYELLQRVTGLTAQEHPRWFCYLMTVLSAGIAYVISVWSVWRLALRHDLPLAACAVLAASLGLATVAPVYARQVNNHILLLAVVSLIMLAIDRRRALYPAATGTLAGIGYTLDLGVGPVLVLCTAALVAYRSRRLMAIACFCLFAAPWLAAHHAVNYHLGGTFGPANSVAAYLAWPGSPFSVRNMTGGWAHHNLGHFSLYAAALLFGKHGFLNYNLPFFLALPSAAFLSRRRLVELPELSFAVAFSGGAWLLYAALSNNYSGPCCSIRWFVPFLAPGYFVLVLAVRERRQPFFDLRRLTCLGACLACLLWWRGPWEGAVPYLLWPLNVMALLLLVLQRRPPGEEVGYKLARNVGSLAPCASHD